MRNQLIPRAERFETCIGVVERSFVTAPNTKYNPDGVFKIRLYCDLAEPAVQAFKAKVDAAAQAAFVAKVPETQRDAWEPFLPYEVAEDGGSICFRFYRGAKVTAARNNQVVSIPISVFDAAGAYLPSPPYIGDGSLVKVLAEFHPINIEAARKAGVRFEFSAVKVLRLAQPESPFSEDKSPGELRA